MPRGEDKSEGKHKFPDVSKMGYVGAMMRSRMERRAEQKAASEGRDLYKDSAPKKEKSAPSRKRGGPVRKGRKYKVGEKGPEKFVPKRGTRRTAAKRTRKPKKA